MDEQQGIQSAFAGCNLERLAEQIPLKDWLGHIGVLLRYTEDAERENLLLTKEIVPQLDEYLLRGPDMLRPLHWSELEMVESDILKRGFGEA